MIIEWRAHNMLYALHIKRNRTRTVDLDINEPWYLNKAKELRSKLE